MINQFETRSSRVLLYGLLGIISLAGCGNIQDDPRFLNQHPFGMNQQGWHHQGMPHQGMPPSTGMPGGQLPGQRFDFSFGGSGTGQMGTARYEVQTDDLLNVTFHATPQGGNPQTATIQSSQFRDYYGAIQFRLRVNGQIVDSPLLGVGQARFYVPIGFSPPGCQMFQQGLAYCFNQCAGNAPPQASMNLSHLTGARGQGTRAPITLEVLDARTDGPDLNCSLPSIANHGLFSNYRVQGLITIQTN